jgi:hypothetical protein
MEFLCGNPQASQAFYTRNKEIIEVVTHAHDFCHELVWEAQGKIDKQEHHVIWLLAGSCLKEFEEILLLAGNGFGTGSVKLMRSFYERVATLSYLAAHPDEIQRFVAYSDIHWHKLLVEAEEVHSDFKLDSKDRARIEENYKKQKDDFQQKDCEKCKLHAFSFHGPSWI